MSNVIIVGGGLAGLSAAHTVLQNGGNVVVIDKCAFLGGNSTKATSGINGSGTSTQAANGIQDSREVFYDDIAKSAGEGLRPELVKVLAYESGPAIEWLMDDFDLDLTRVARLGAHSNPRTHRGDGGRFPGAMITMTLMETFDDIRDNQPERARLINKARVTELIKENGNVIGCRFEKDGQIMEEYGPVILSTGGFGADFNSDSLLADVYEEWKGLKAWKDVKDLPNLLTLPTTNGDHCTGDGIKLGLEVGAGTVDMEAVQVHPTGMVMPSEPDAKVKFLAAEALRGQGGILLDRHGKRFCDDVGKRDYVSSMMWNNEGPFRLCLNSKAAKDMEWHCKHYESRGLMTFYKTGADLAKAMGISAADLEANLEQNNKWEAEGNDPWGKKYFHNGPTTIEDSYFVAQVTPVVHYTMGGLHMNAQSQVLKPDGTPITGLYCAGEVMGGVHGKNRLGGNSLLDCVVYGRVSGKEASKYMLSSLLNGSAVAPGVAGGAAGRIQRLGQHIDPASFGVTISQGGVSTTVQVSPNSKNVTLDINWDGAGSAPVVTASGDAAPAPAVEAEQATSAGPDTTTEISWEEIKKHTSEDDCWIVVEGKVYSLAEFLPDHPGGKKAPLIYAGKDATEEFMMLHKPELLEKYAKEYQVGVCTTPYPE